MGVTKSRQALYAVAYSSEITALHCATNRNTSVPEKLPKDEGDSLWLKGQLRTCGSASQRCADYNVVLYYILLVWDQ